MADSLADVSDVLKVGILTISDRCSSGQMDDRSGPAIRQVVVETDWEVTQYNVIPDNPNEIRQILVRWCDDGLCDCILTTGGTGLSTRDFTPESTVAVLDRQLPHLATQIALSDIESVPTAILSRGVAGTRRQTLIVNLPGSVNGATNGAKIVVKIARHAVDVLRGQGDKGHG